MLFLYYMSSSKRLNLISLHAHTNAHTHRHIYIYIYRVFLLFASRQVQKFFVITKIRNNSISFQVQQWLIASFTKTDRSRRTSSPVSKVTRLHTIRFLLAESIKTKNLPHKV